MGCVMASIDSNILANIDRYNKLRYAVKCDVLSLYEDETD